ncbi:MAG: DUF11 domain-containing protein, partial [Colwellia sp.]|nr:DUF11 domain-containing protein [Colwellia sp.]
PFPGEVTELRNTASLTDDGATGPDLDPTNNSDGHLVDVIAAPDLVLAKDDGGAGVLAGATLGYTLRVSNVGTQHAVTVVLDETVPDHTTFNAGASAPGWVCTGTAPGSACRLSITPVNVGDPAVAVAFAVDVPSPAPLGVEALVNTAVATNLAENGVPVADLNPADNTATASTPLLAAPDLVLTKTDGGVTVTADEGVVYTLTIANTGNQGATGVELTERVPANSRFATLVNDPAWSCSGSSAGSVCTLPLGSLPVGAAPRTATFAVRVDSPLAAGVTEIV